GDRFQFSASRGAIDHLGSALRASRGFLHREPRRTFHTLVQLLHTAPIACSALRAENSAPSLCGCESSASELAESFVARRHIADAPRRVVSVLTEPLLLPRWSSKHSAAELIADPY